MRELTRSVRAEKRRFGAALEAAFTKVKLANEDLPLADVAVRGRSTIGGVLSALAEITEEWMRGASSRRFAVSRAKLPRPRRVMACEPCARSFPEAPRASLI